MIIFLAILLIGIISILGSFLYAYNLSGIPPVRQLPAAAGAFRGYARALQAFETATGTTGTVSITQLQQYANPYTVSPIQAISGSNPAITSGVCGGYETVYTNGSFTVPIIQYIWKADQYNCSYGISGVYNGVNGVLTPCGVTVTPSCMTIPAGAVVYLTSSN